VTISVHAPLATGRLLTGRVVTLHRRAANLASSDGQFFTVVDAELGNGPATIAMDGAAPLPWQEGQVVRLHLPPDALPWSPAAPPAFRALQSPAREIAMQALLATAPRDGCLPAVAPLLLDGNLPDTGYSPGIKALAARRWQLAVAELAGLGPGLTPSGDDLLMGYLLALDRVRAARAGDLAKAINALPDGQTTPISHHLLRWAARGVAGEQALHWLDSVIMGRPVAPDWAAVHGATSGFDWAAGALLALHHLATVKERSA
jgi:hypothetical protein